MSRASFLLLPLRLICLSGSWNLQLIETWVASKVNLQAQDAQEVSSLTEELIALGSSSAKVNTLCERHLLDLAVKDSELQDTQTERDNLALELSCL